MIVAIQKATSNRTKNNNTYLNIYIQYMKIMF